MTGLFRILCLGSKVFRPESRSASRTLRALSNTERAQWIKQLISAAVLSLVVLPGSGQSIPDNGTPNPYGNGWTCNRGYYRSGNYCVEVKPPANASLNSLGKLMSQCVV
jgi:hypothetical protein